MKTNPAYIKAKRAFLAGKQCAVYPWLKATQIHHIRGRLGPLLTNRRYWLPVSAIAHAWIHSNPNAARAEGYLAALGCWNRTRRTHHD